MIKSVCKAMFILGLGSLTLAHAASVNPPLLTAENGGIDMFTGSPSTDYKTYLNFTGVGTQTLKTEKALGKFSPFMYLAGNQALEAQQLENLIGDQMKIMSQLGIMTMPTWQSVDAKTNDLFVNNHAPIYAALLGVQGSESDGNPISPTSIQMDTYIANLAVMANQNEAAILARLQSCMSQGSLKQCGSAQS